MAPRADLRGAEMMDGTLFQTWPDQPRIDDPRPMIVRGNA